MLDSLNKYNNTAAVYDGSVAIVRLHKTNILRMDETENFTRTITLDSGGWMTITTKKRMNEALAIIAPQISVFQKKYEWFIDTGDDVVKFHDGMQIKIDHGRVTVA